MKVRLYGSGRRRSKRNREEMTSQVIEGGETPQYDHSRRGRVCDAALRKRSSVNHIFSRGRFDMVLLQREATSSSAPESVSYEAGGEHTWITEGYDRRQRNITTPFLSMGQVVSVKQEYRRCVWGFKDSNMMQTLEMIMGIQNRWVVSFCWPVRVVQFPIRHVSERRSHHKNLRVSKI